MMDTWALPERYGGSVGFVCVSCAGPALAEAFVRELQLQHTDVTWIAEEADMPSWGQLGCSGFIVLDGSGAVASRATSAYLSVKEEAFRDVERILDDMLGRKPVPPASKRGRVDASVACSRCAEVRFGGDCGTVNTREREASIPAPAPVASVKVDVLDDEHRDCELRLAELEEAVAAAEGGASAEGVAAALRAVVSAYESHFAHEEKLLDEFLYAEVLPAEGGDAPERGFSADRNARTSHFADHQAMLSSLAELLHDAAAVDAAAVSRIRRDFERHATLYDGAYADRLSVAMTA